MAPAQLSATGLLCHPNLLKFILWLKHATSLPIRRHEYEDKGLEVKRSLAVVSGNEPLNGINSSFQTEALINNFNFLGVWQTVLFDRVQRRMGLGICQSVLTHYLSVSSDSIVCQYHLSASSVGIICVDMYATLHLKQAHYKPRVM